MQCQKAKALLQLGDGHWVPWHYGFISFPCDSNTTLCKTGKQFTLDDKKMAWIELTDEKLVVDDTNVTSAPIDFSSASYRDHVIQLKEDLKYYGSLDPTYPMTVEFEARKGCLVEAMEAGATQWTLKAGQAEPIPPVRKCLAQGVYLAMDLDTNRFCLKGKTQSYCFDIPKDVELYLTVGSATKADIVQSEPPDHPEIDYHFLLHYKTFTDKPFAKLYPFPIPTPCGPFSGCGYAAPMTVRGSNCPPLFQ
jgi:hypothetical protein